MPGAPQQIWPQGANIPGGNEKSGVTPVAAAQLEVPMVQRSPAPPLQTSRETSRSTLTAVPSQLKAVRRVCETAVWAPASILISTYCAVGSPLSPDITSSIFEMWKTAQLVPACRSTSNETTRMGTPAMREWLPPVTGDPFPISLRFVPGD